MNDQESVGFIIERIELKYRKCSKCGRNGVRKSAGKVKCFYCGEQYGA